jgi:hypothetical protein
MGASRAKPAQVEEAGPAAERHSGSETVLEPQPGPTAARHTPGEQERPLPPIPIPPVGVSSAWQLVVLRSPAGAGLEAGQVFPLKGEVKIGRFGDVDIKLLDSKVSREHARIEIEGSQCRITDLNSSNGTYINGRRLSGSTELKDGDEIKLGDTFFVLDQRPV